MLFDDIDSTYISNQITLGNFNKYKKWIDDYIHNK